MLITTSPIRYNSKLIFSLLFFSLTTLPSDLPADLSVKRDFYMAACSTIDFKKFHRGHGAEETVAEIWHDREHAPERAYREAALPSAALRIKHKARKVLETGVVDGRSFAYHEITWHTLMLKLGEDSTAITAKRECVSYPHGVKPHLTVDVPPTKETVDLLLADVARLSPFFARTKPDSLAQKMADEFEEMNTARAGAGAGAGSK